MLRCTDFDLLSCGVIENREGLGGIRNEWSGGVLKGLYGARKGLLGTFPDLLLTSMEETESTATGGE